MCEQCIRAYSDRAKAKAKAMSLCRTVLILYQYHVDQVKAKLLSLSTESLWYPFLERIRFALYWVDVIQAVFSLCFFLFCNDVCFL